uniref:Uncharacterized protein n=1 Tax=Florenciella sp. virus SA2 TaxID=3240092 RepID=A0AB39JB88_9VIRU
MSKNSLFSDICYMVSFNGSNSIKLKQFWLLEWRQTGLGLYHTTHSSTYAFVLCTMTLNLKSFSDLAVAQHCRIYGEIMAELNVPGVPNEQEFYALVQAKISQMEQDRSPKQMDSLFRQEVLGSVNLSPKSFAPAFGGSDFKLTSKEIKAKPLIHKTTSTDEEGAVTETTVTLDFPFLHGVDYSETCQSLKCAGGLFAPCLTRPAKGSNFCKACVKPGKDGTTSLSKYGTVTDRQSCAMLCYSDTKGKKEVGFGTYCKKRGVERAQAEALIRSAFGDNVALPEEYWSIDKTKASRPVKKSVSVSSDDEASVAEEPAKVAEVAEPPAKVAEVAEEPAKVAEEAEEPAKVAEETEEADETEEPAQASEETASSDVSVNSSESAKKKRRGRPKKPVDPNAPVIAKKKGRGRPKKTNRSVTDEADKSAEDASPAKNSDNKSEEGESEEGDFKQVTWEGKTYYVDEENTMFIMIDDDFELYGTWDPEEKIGRPVE